MKTMHRWVSLGSIAATLMLCNACSTQSYTWDRPLIHDEQAYLTRPEAGRPGQTEVPMYNRAAPAPMPKKMAKPVPGCGPNEFVLKSSLLQLQTLVPARTVLGQTVESDLVVTPLDNCAEVVITDMVPDDATYVKSEPAAQVTGRKLAWMFDTLDKDHPVTIKIWYKTDQEGCLVSCATMTAIPRGCARTLVGSAKLEITCQLPATAKVGEMLNKLIEVRNTGTAAATDVVVTDTLPDGLTAVGPLTFNLGEIAPGQTKQITVPVKAAQRGEQTNAAMVMAGNATGVKTECQTLVTQPGLNITKDGTKTQYLGRNAKYDIVVSNTGDTELQNVVVTDVAPPETRIVSADGATVSGNTAAWKVGTLAKGGKETLGLTLTSLVPGDHCNSVTVDCTDGLTGNARACTMWKGVSAILLETRDDPDPVGIGETVTYTIRVTNQGTADDNNIKLIAMFEKEVDPVSATDGMVNGKKVTFTPVAKLAPKEVATFTITAKGVKPGDHRLKVSLTSDMLSEPVTHEESTTVY